MTNVPEPRWSSSGCFSRYLNTTIPSCLLVTPSPFGTHKWPRARPKPSATPMNIRYARCHLKMFFFCELRFLLLCPTTVIVQFHASRSGERGFCTAEQDQQKYDQPRVELHVSLLSAFTLPSPSHSENAASVRAWSRPVKPRSAKKRGAPSRLRIRSGA